VHADLAPYRSQTASFLAETLSADDAFFGHLSAVFQSNSTLAERLLPHLVLAVLLQHDGNPNSPESPRTILSGYFSLLLRSSFCDSAIRRSILNVILYLRHSAPSRPAHPLAYNTWLDVDWLLLGEAAVKCKTYTTALLFLETRRDGWTGAKSSEAEAENALLYEIYSNIEDPDGFYGIAATDARSSLVRRLHHEDEWSRAFGYHGADFQITPASSMDRSSVVGDVVQC
jgi:serine-protein kinase ATM